jgi:hypothetical protein
MRVRPRIEGQQLGGHSGRHREPSTTPAPLDCAERGNSEHPSRVGHQTCRQRAVSAQVHRSGVPDDSISLLHRLIGDDPDAGAQILGRANHSTSTPVLVAAALLAQDAELLTRATQYATTTRDRQLVALGEAHLRGNADLFDVLVRDHLSEHPDNLLAAWIAGRAIPSP